MRLLRVHLADQVDRHVVRRRKRTPQRVGAGGCQSRDLSRLRRALLGMPDHHGVALNVDSPAPGPTGQLGVLPRRQRHVLLAVELHQLLQDDGAGRHVDAQSQCLGGEYGLDQTGREQFLHRMAEDRQHSGVVRGQAAEQSLTPLVIVQDGKVGVGKVATPPVDHLGDTDPILLSRQPKRAAQALLDSGVTPGPREDEGDRRQ